jgi:hypothetical protein
LDTRRAQTRRLQEDDRLAEFRKQFYQSVLPDLPKIPGYHVCWLTTTNPADSIQRRTRLGYEPIKASEIPGWEYASLKTGQYAGCIGVNEMVAFKLPIHLFEAFMYESHHKQPQEEEEKLRAMVDQMKEMMAQVAKSGMKGIKLITEDGQGALGQEAPEPPSFAEAIGEA